MPLSAEQKKAVVADVAGLAGTATAIIVANYQGLSCLQFDEMRRSARAHGVNLRVVKNTLVKHALKDTSFAALAEKVDGPLVYAFSGEDIGAAGGLMKEYSGKMEALDVCWIAYDGKVADDRQTLDFLAGLPTREETLAQLCGVMKAPVSKLVGALAEVPGKLVRLLEAIRKNRQSD